MSRLDFAFLLFSYFKYVGVDIKQTDALTEPVNCYINFQEYVLVVRILYYEATKRRRTQILQTLSNLFVERNGEGH